MADANVTVKITPDVDPRYLDLAARVDQPYTADVRFLISSLMSQLELDPDFVGEIVILPGSVEVRVQLANADGKKYVWGTGQDPDVRAGDPRNGRLAEEVRVYRARTYGGSDGDHATDDHPVLQDPDGEGPAPDSEGP